MPRITIISESMPATCAQFISEKKVNDNFYYMSSQETIKSKTDFVKWGIFSCLNSI